MDNTRSPSTVVSPDTDKPHILDLNKANGEEYHKFIKSIIDEFKPQDECQKLRGKDKPRESETLKEINDHIKLCFDLETLVVELINDKPGEDSPAQTPFEDDIPSPRKFFQVMLTYNQHDLQILIQRSSMYLAGYKVKYKDDKAKIDDNAECWIILSGGCCDAAVKFVEEFLTPDEPRIVKLGSSYFKFFSPFDSEFERKKQQALATNLYKKLTRRMEQLINREEKTDYVVQILQKMKKKMEEDMQAKMERNPFDEGELLEERNPSDEVELLDQELKRADHLLNWLDKNRYSLEASEPANAEAKGDEGAERFKKYWRERFEKLDKISDRDAMKKLIKMLKVKQKFFLSQGQNGTDAVKQQSDFNQSLILWETEIQEAVKILSSLGYEIKIGTKMGEKNKDMLKRKEKEKEKLKGEGKTEEELKEDLPEKIKLIKLLEKAIPQEDKSSGVIKNFLTKNLEEECGLLLQRNGIFDELKMKTDDLNRGIINLYSEVMAAKDLYELYEELKKIATTLDKLMRYFRTGASYSVENEKIKDFEVNGQALIRAFEHLTQNPFKDDEEDFAKHITHLVVMICEATRFIPIAEHIKKCYPRDEKARVISQKYIVHRPSSLLLWCAAFQYSLLSRYVVSDSMD